MSAQDNATLARTIYEAFGNDDFDRVLTYAMEDIEVVFVPFGQTVRGHEGFRQFMQGYKTAFPDMRLEVTDQVASEDGVASEFIARGTHTGPLIGPVGEIPPTGRRVELRAAEVWRIENGKIASLHNYQDTATMMQQLGLISQAEQTGT